MHNIRDKNIFRLFAIAFAIHLCSALFLYVMIYHTSLRPLGGGGDFDLYQNNAIEIAHRLRAGNFSLQGMFTEHYFAVLIGVIYAVTVPHIIVGQFLTVWLAGLSAVLVYLVAIEIGGSKRWAFLIALMASVYPSYLYFCSVLLKEIIVIPLVLLGILVLLKMYKQFSMGKFLAFFAVVSALIHFRFYIGFALLYAAMICWFFISNFTLKKRIKYGLIFVFILGLSPHLMGYGYMGYIPIKMYLTKTQIINLREVAYAPASGYGSPAQAGESSAGGTNAKGEVVGEWDLSRAVRKATEEGKNLDGRTLTPAELEKGSGSNSSFSVSSGLESPPSFLTNYSLSFAYTLLGPFPWQLKVKRQLISLVEMIPYWFFLGVIGYNIFWSIKKNGWKGFSHTYKYALPLAVFCLIGAGALSLFINNFGIIARIRMPVFILLLCILSLDTSFMNFLERFGKKLPYVKNYLT